MRTLQRFATVCFLGAAVAALAAGCSSSDNTDTNPGGAGKGSAGSPGTAGSGTAGSGTAGAAAAGAPGMMGDATKGAAAYKKATCDSCHGTNGEGMLGPNITGSSAGIGTMTEPQFLDAIRNGKNKNGMDLCFLMTKFPASSVSDADVADIYAFLKSKPVDTAMAGMYCSSGCPMCTSTH